jgi:hypothetical protein
MPPSGARSRTLIVVLAVALVAALFWWTQRGSDADETVTIPAEWVAPQWEQLLGGDAGVADASYTKLTAYHPGLDTAQAQVVANVAVPLVTADLVGTNRSTWPQYWPPASTTGTPAPKRCENVSALAVSAAELPTTDRKNRVWVKALVPYTGVCGQNTFTKTAPGVEYVYGHLAGDTFEPVREWDVPQAQVDAGTADLADYQLAELTTCASAGAPTRLRSFAAAALDKMCEAAAADGVVLVTADGYRSRTDQAKLFDKAVKHYGSKEEALKWVAFADSTQCQSKHCLGTAVNVEDDNAATSWLWTVVGCTANGKTVQSQTCENGAPVRRAQTFGFVLPYERIPGYLEFALPADDNDLAAPNCAPAGVSTDQMVASVFRCRLGRAMVSPDVTERVVSEALVVSKCASGWNPSAQVYAGRYAADANPADGRVYSEAGVFALRSQLVETGWVKGEVTDPVANINAAASLWLATRGWEQSACATGTDPGLKAGPVLPGYGGPTIPAWATQY